MPTSSTTNAAILTLPTAEVALAGVNTPLGGMSIAGPDTAEVTLIITAAAGTLYAGTFPGATVSGGGTGSLWIAGSPAQVNAKLATLVYAAPTACADTLTVSLIDPSAPASGPVFLPLQVLPLIAPLSPPAPPVTISGGTLTLDTRQIDGITLDIHDQRTGAGAATLVLVNSTLGPNTTLDIAALDSASPAPRLAIAGNVDLDGTTSFGGGPALVTLAEKAVLTNTGLIAFNASSAQVTGTGTLQNDGTIVVAAAPPGASPAIDTAIVGSGVIALAAGSRLALGASVAASETIGFQANSGLLELDALQSMHATIAGFVPGDQIQLGEIEIDASDYQQTGTGGTLTLYDGAQVSGVLHFDGVHQLSDFIITVKTDSASDGGAISTLSVLTPTATGVTSPAAAPDVYRFFDSANGTQFLTPNASERDAIIATRPDLDFEGVAMHASSAADPAAVAVYRFFDTAHGTHFFTADPSEKNALLATRPDLAFEPSSTIWEHATLQAGDVPVFRFFDTIDGTHFYTSSAAERASILTTRLDLRPEGVAFYAPAQ